VAVLGDSFAAGSGASTSDTGWVRVMAKERDWQVTNLAAPGVGYARARANAGSYVTRVQAVVAADPALVLITGGANDIGLPPESVSKAVTDTVGGIRAGAPSAVIVIVTPWWDQRPADSRFAAVIDRVKRAATDSGATWLDTGQPLTGRSELLTADGLQPNDQGHRALATTVLEQLAKAGLISR
jgi:lysophospholipase L1-like esterase